MSMAQEPTGAPLVAPPLLRRMAAFVYEGVLLFGVLVISALIYSPLAGQTHALKGRSGLQAVLFAVLAVYFVFFWTRGGQTVATKAWHIRLVMADGRAVPPGRALLRYVLAWLWFVPAVAMLYVTGLTRGTGAFYVALLAGVLGYAALSLLRPDRQFWHDAVCGTRLIDWRPARRAKAESGG